MPLPTKVFTALDVADVSSAENLVGQLLPINPFFKVGLELFLAGGTHWIRSLSDKGAEIFLDLKFHDIPNTVSQALKQVLALNVHSTNIHLMGGEEMARAAFDTFAEIRAKHQLRTKLLGVTLLTSASQNSLLSLGIAGEIGDRVLSLAEMGKRAGIDGVVCSALEVKSIKERLGHDFITVVPGIRPAWAAVTGDDQQRVMTPLQAAREGADFLVIGRPILRAPSPSDALQSVLDSL